MRLALISDIHANLEALQAVLEDIYAQRVELIICLGDIVGYNSSPSECIRLLEQHNVVCVAGNHERAVTGHIGTEGFSEIAARAVAWTRRHLDLHLMEHLATLPIEVSIPDTLVAVHGALFPENERTTLRLNSDERRRLSFEALRAHSSQARICAFGHTHHPGVFEYREGSMQELTGDHLVLNGNGWYLVNPGAIGHSRTQDHRATYMVIDTLQRELTIRRVSYDINRTIAKSRSAGLLPFWISPPAPVRVLGACLPKSVRASIKSALRAFYV